MVENMGFDELWPDPDRPDLAGGVGHHTFEIIELYANGGWRQDVRRPAPEAARYRQWFAHWRQLGRSALN